MRLQIVKGVSVSGGNRNCASSEMTRAGDVVRRVADYDELRRLKFQSQVLVDAFGRQRREIAAIKSFFAKRTRKLKVLGEADAVYLELRCRPEVASEQRRSIPRVAG